MPRGKDFVAGFLAVGVGYIPQAEVCSDLSFNRRGQRLVDLAKRADYVLVHLAFAHVEGFKEIRRRETIDDLFATLDLGGVKDFQ